jgi:hypothetical protein
MVPMAMEALDRTALVVAVPGFRVPGFPVRALAADDVGRPLLLWVAAGWALVGGLAVPRGAACTGASMDVSMLGCVAGGRGAAAGFGGMWARSWFDIVPIISLRAR